MTSDGPEGREFDLAFMLDKIDSGVVRTFVDSGRFDLVSVDGVDDLIRSVDMFRSSTTTKAITLGKDSLSEQNSVPSRMVTSIETQTILACSADLRDWDAYQITRTLNEHFKELGLQAEQAAQVPQSDPGSTFDYPIHDGAARYYRRGVTVEAFPYQALVWPSVPRSPCSRTGTPWARNGVPTGSPAGLTTSSSFTMTTPNESPANSAR